MGLLLLVEPDWKPWLALADVRRHFRPDSRSLLTAPKRHKLQRRRLFNRPSPINMNRISNLQHRGFRHHSISFPQIRPSALVDVMAQIQIVQLGWRWTALLIRARAIWFLHLLRGTIPRKELMDPS